MDDVTYAGADTAAPETGAALDPETQAMIRESAAYVRAEQAQTAEAAEHAHKQARFNQLASQVDSLLEKAGYPAELRGEARERALDSIFIAARRDPRLNSMDAVPEMFNRWHGFQMAMHQGRGGGSAEHAAPTGKVPALSDRDAFVKHAIAFLQGKR